MNKPVVFMTDLDGTLLTDDKKILESERIAAEEFKKSGGRLAIATGRTITASRQYFDIIKPDFPSVFYNGSVVYDVENDKILYHKSLDEPVYDVVYQIMNRFKNVMTEIVRINGLYVFNHSRRGDEHLKICRETPIECSFENIEKTGWLKVLFAGEPEIIDEIVSYISGKKIDSADFVRSAPQYYEMLPKNSSKGNAVKYIFEALGYEKEILAAAGDYDNDIEMLKYADISAAPINAQSCVRKCVSFVSDKSNNNGAVSTIIFNIIKNYLIKNKDI